MIKEFTSEDIEKLEKLYRAAFVNSLGGFKSVVLIGTTNSQKHENLAVFSSLFHIGANPALCGIIVRPSEVPRHTLNNILELKQYTINHITDSFYVNAHQTSARYDENISEFKEAKLTPEYIDSITAPFVKESKIKFACQLEQKIDLEINGTILLIGKIIYVSIPDNCLMTDGSVNLEAAKTITVSGLNSYHTTKKIGSLFYAKPATWPKEINL
ncbi:flavin reductase family protein [Sediminibacterium sp.]|uniref:flavin reductase family protein n=1 Tax=Sediminibacterium sp. TaxID=1917865 RepID=UPI002734C5D7|nr:flavin reductase [Sediminibacterium sp.]MDP3567411.1 flavin reductase [Sediminibacterium sp.]